MYLLFFYFVGDKVISPIGSIRSMREKRDQWNARVFQGTRKTLSKELIWAVDADTPSESLVYTVLHAETDAGYVEKLNQTTHPIDTFTQAELEQGLIAYVHRGNGKRSRPFARLIRNEIIEPSENRMLCRN